MNFTDRMEFRYIPARVPRLAISSMIVEVYGRQAAAVIGAEDVKPDRFLTIDMLEEIIIRQGRIGWSAAVFATFLACVSPSLLTLGGVAGPFPIPGLPTDSEDIFSPLEQVFNEVEQRPETIIHGSPPPGPLPGRLGISGAAGLSGQGPYRRFPSGLVGNPCPEGNGGSSCGRSRGTLGSGIPSV